MGIWTKVKDYVLATKRTVDRQRVDIVELQLKNGQLEAEKKAADLTALLHQTVSRHYAEQLGQALEVQQAEKAGYNSVLAAAALANGGTLAISKENLELVAGAAVQLDPEGDGYLVRIVDQQPDRVPLDDDPGPTDEELAALEDDDDDLDGDEE